jgi:hypothetical protein
MLLKPFFVIGCALALHIWIAPLTRSSSSSSRSNLGFRFLNPTFLQEKYHLRILQQHFLGDFHLTCNLALCDGLHPTRQIVDGFLDPLHEVFFPWLLSEPLVEMMVGDLLLE